MGIKRKVLVVEDTRFNQVLAESLLTVWGYESVMANNAKEALSLLKGDNFDMILLDMMMPEIDGLEFLRLMQKQKNKTPVIVISAKVDHETINEAKELGAIDYITKPFDSNRLKIKLNEFFSQVE